MEPIQGKYETLLRVYFSWKMKCFPIFATTQGIREFDGIMPDRRVKAAEANQAQCEVFRREVHELLEQAPTTGQLDEKQRRYLALLLFEVNTFLRGYPHQGHLLPDVNFLEGIQDKLPRYMRMESFCVTNSMEELERILDRLRGIRDYVEGLISTLRQGMAVGVTYSQESMSRVQGQFERLQVGENVSKSDFYAPFQSLATHIDPERGQAIQSEARALIRTQVLPSFKALGDFLEREYSAKLRSSPGIGSIPNGNAFYRACLEFHTSIPNLDPVDVHQTGLGLVKALMEGVARVSNSVGWEGTPQAFLKHVQNDPRQRFQSKDELVQYVHGLISQRIAPKMEAIIHEDYLTPEFYQIDVEPLPPGNGAMAFYSRASQDGRQKAAFWLNLEKVENFKRFELMSLALHEAIPGHHFHLTVFNQRFGFPDFIKNPVYDDISLSPSRPPFYTAHIEGWGLYSEHLGFELGLFDDPYDLLGYYSWNLLRSARLVVDTGIHHYGWSRSRALEYLTTHTALSIGNSEVDIDRYITWPGQAVSYKLGEIKILEFRRSEEQRLGDVFDLKSFHSQVLARIGPLDQLGQAQLTLSS